MGMLLSLNGQKLTDAGRDLSQPIEIRAVTNELASGTLRRYLKAQKRSFSINWQWLPGLAGHTHDGGLARDGIYAAISTGTSLLLTSEGVSSTETYVVLVDSYEEQLLRRDYVLGDTFWNVSLGLKEV